MAVTLAQATKALEAVKSQYRAHWDTGDRYAAQPPKLVQNWDWLESGPTPWAIVWEEGPFEWAYRAAMGGLDEEACALASDLIGEDEVSRKVKEERFGVEEPVATPGGYYLEPVTTWAVSIQEV
jgi:hypothetical protein